MVQYKRNNKGKSKKKAAPKKNTSNSSEMRLAKAMAHRGFCSRREADYFILKGWVKVNGEVVLQKGYKVTKSDHIELNESGQTAMAQKVTILLNKPVGYVSAQPEDDYKAAIELITKENHWSKDRSGQRFSRHHLRGLAPAGRLDIDSKGLLTLTNDGRIARQLILEESEKEKEYLVRVSGELKAGGLALLNYGLSLDGEKLKPAKVEWQNEDQLHFVLQQGKKRQIRRMCQMVGLKVTGLKRVRMGKIVLGGLPEGKWRYLGPDEEF